MTALAASAFEPAAGEERTPLPRKYLHPGSVYFTRESELVSTILGSCVAICLYAVDGGAAGMNHYLLPERPGVRSTKFADVANEELLAHFARNGVAPAGLRAKVFGGASMGMFKSDLAQRNVEAAFRFLERNAIPVVSADTAGQRGRKLLFHTSNGAAWVRLL